MPRQQGLLRRGSRYFTNFKVPKDLRQAMGKEHIRLALGTSDYREASQRIAYQRARWMATFEEKRRLLAPAPAKAKRPLFTVSDADAFAFGCKNLIRREAVFRDWQEEKGRFLEPHELERVIENVGIEANALAGVGPYAPDDGRWALKRFLEQEGIDCPADSPAFAKLLPMFRRSEAEHAHRRLEQLEGRPALPFDVAFRDIAAHTAPPAASEQFTIGCLLERFTAYQRDAQRAPATLRAYGLPLRLLGEHFGESSPLAILTSERMEGFFKLLQRYPLNGEQRYKGKKINDAISAADSVGDSRRLNARTISNYFGFLTALFNYAVEKEMMSKNPLKDRYIRNTFGKRPEQQPREQFTINELNRLFSAPPFQPGHSEFKTTARFWVPLLSLFHGMREEEACQLHAANVGERDGIPFLSIAASQSDGDAKQRLKNATSKRDVPIHPAIMALGFMDFVKQRQEEGAVRLFPELKRSVRGKLSDIFCKWFKRLVLRSVGKECRATFHSFRHMFRDAAAEAGIPSDILCRLAGWNNGKTMADHYGGGSRLFRKMADAIAKIEFPGLDLSLEPEKPLIRRAKKPCRSRD